MWLWATHPSRSLWREKADDSSIELLQHPSVEGNSFSSLQSSVSLFLGVEKG